MRTLYVWLVASLVALGAVAEEPAPTPVPVNLSHAHVPIGFDDNDRVQVIVAGNFYSTCYQVGPTTATVDAKRKEIRFLQTAYIYGGFCIEVSVEFNQVVDLEMLPAGHYTLVDEKSGRKIGSLPVKRSTHPGPGPDDFLYASVSDVVLAKDPVTSQHALVLSGAFPASCLSLKDIYIGYHDNVIVVQPVALKRQGEECREGRFPFQVTSLIEKDLAAGDYLVHVRVMNGRAINKMISLVPGT